MPIGVIFSFGDKKLSSGLPFGIKDAPYFLSAFIGEKEQVNRMYLGALYQEGALLLCIQWRAYGANHCHKFEVNNRFKNVFKQEKTPLITGFTFEMNTNDTKLAPTPLLKDCFLF